MTNSFSVAFKKCIKDIRDHVGNLKHKVTDLEKEKEVMMSEFKVDDPDSMPNLKEKIFDLEERLEARGQIGKQLLNENQQLQQRITAEENSFAAFTKHHMFASKRYKKIIDNLQETLAQFIKNKK